MGHEGAAELKKVYLAPVDRRDHRPQHEREIARMLRALEQATDELGADERIQSGRIRS